MISHHWTIDAAPTAPTTHLSQHEARARARADYLMAWGHCAALAGGLAGIAGGFGLVASGTLSPMVMALLFTAPVGGMVMSGLLYAAAWRVDARPTAPVTDCPSA